MTKYALIAIWLLGALPAYVAFDRVACSRASVKPVEIWVIGFGALMWPAMVIGRVAVWGYNPVAAAQPTGCPA